MSSKTKTVELDKMLKCNCVHYVAEEEWSTTYDPINAEVNKVKCAKLGGAFLTSSGKAVFIKKVIYSDPATIVLWNDGTKTVAKCAPRDVYFPETGLAVAIIKKLVGGDRVRNLFTQWLPETDDNEVVEISDARKRQKEE